jgi:hypothetical protein
LDSFDYVERRLWLEGKLGSAQVFNGISLYGKLTCQFSLQLMTAKNTVLTMIEHWQQLGIPDYQ